MEEGEEKRGKQRNIMAEDKEQPKGRKFSEESRRIAKLAERGKEGSSRSGCGCGCGRLQNKIAHPPHDDDGSEAPPGFGRPHDGALGVPAPRVDGALPVHLGSAVGATG